MSVMPTTNHLQDSSRSESDQVKPLAHNIIIDEDEALSMEMNKEFHHRTCLKWCGCVSAVILILSMILLILIFTLFGVKDPVLKMNSVTVQGFYLGIDNYNLRPGTNLTVLANVSVKNPNVASFRYNQVNTSLHYYGNVIAEVTTPPGLAKARRTILMNVTMVVLVDRVLAVPQLPIDLMNGSLLMRSYTEISGKVKILNIIKKHVVVRLNCTMTVDLRSQSVRDQRCKKQIV